MNDILFSNAMVFDGTDSPRFAADVLVAGNRIASVEPAASSDPANFDDWVDCTGRTVMPGLTDAHTHLALGSTVERQGAPGNNPPEVTALISAHCGRVMLDYGYTSAYSGGGGSMEAEVAVKRAFDDGLVPGPRFIASSFERLPGGEAGLVFSYPEHTTRPSAPAEVVRFVEEAANIGVNAIKLMLNGVSAFEPGANFHEQFYDEEVLAAGEAANRLGVWLTAHCYTSHAIMLALRAGCRILYHCNYADAAAIDALEAHKDSVFVGLAPGNEESGRDAAPKFGVMAGADQVHEQVDGIEHIKWVGNELRKRAIRSLPGGDYGFPWNPVGRNSRDLELFVDWFGYTPSEALRAATQYGGQLMGLGHELGLVRAGYLADLLVVDGDPTADIGLLLSKTSITQVMKDGRFHRR